MPVGLLAAVPSPSKPTTPIFAPPLGFRAAEGVVAAWISGEGPFGATPKRLRGTAAQRAGVRYERAALKYLAQRFGAAFTPSQWFRYWDGHAIRFCQTDGLLRFPTENLVVIFECKTSFTPDAWWQLRKLYEPVVRAALRPRHIQHVVVCKHFDPCTSFPEPFAHTSLTGAWPWELAAIGLFQWKP